MKTARLLQGQNTARSEGHGARCEVHIQKTQEKFAFSLLSCNGSQTSASTGVRGTRSRIQPRNELSYESTGYLRSVQQQSQFGPPDTAFWLASRQLAWTLRFGSFNEPHFLQWLGTYSGISGKAPATYKAPQPWGQLPACAHGDCWTEELAANSTCQPCSSNDWGSCFSVDAWVVKYCNGLWLSSIWPCEQLWGNQDVTVVWCSMELHQESPHLCCRVGREHCYPEFFCSAYLRCYNNAHHPRYTHLVCVCSNIC